MHHCCCLQLKVAALHPDEETGDGLVFFWFLDYTRQTLHLLFCCQNVFNAARVMSAAAAVLRDLTALAHVKRSVRAARFTLHLVSQKRPFVFTTVRK